MSVLGRPSRLFAQASAPALAQRDRPLALGLIVIALGLMTLALLGPLGSSVIDYRVTQTLRNQVIGLDGVSLFVVAPLALFAARLVLRQRVLGAVLALGIGTYTSYMLIQYVLGPDYGHLAGNNQRLFPLCLVVFTAGWLVAMTAWHAVDSEALRSSRHRERLIGRVVLPVLALVAFIRYVPSLADWMSSTPIDKGYLAGPAFAWTIALLDLGVFLPATVMACVGLVRGAAWARKTLYLVVGWFGLVGPAVAAMAITMYINDDPNASGGNAIFMTALGLAFVALALLVFRPLLQSGPADSALRREPLRSDAEGLGRGSST
jgi:hypothetical protein